MDSLHDALEMNLHDSSSKPLVLPLEFLKAITCDVSTESELGRGGYGVVFKGVLRSGKIIAVKKLSEILLLINDQGFKNEVVSLMGINHRNVVQFVGYCAESSWEAMTLPSGQPVFPEMPKRLLCFEYVSNGSLDKYITDECSGLEWNTRFHIIKGICNGLNYLHEERHLIHLDLKPGNILMDNTMTPKIADFGLSRIFGDQQSRTITDNRAGTRGYMSPEYLIQGMVSYQADIFSLGVIMIEIITGQRDYPLIDPYFLHSGEKDGSQNTEILLKSFIERVVESWKNKFASASIKYKSMEKYTSEQVKECMRIALKCVDGKEKRPSAKDIIQLLKTVDLQMDTQEELPATSETEKMLQAATSKPLRNPTSVRHMFKNRKFDRTASRFTKNIVVVGEEMKCCCELCGGSKYLVCSECNGSRKVLANGKKVSCPMCNLEGLVQCPICPTCSGGATSGVSRRGRPGSPGAEQTPHFQTAVASLASSGAAPLRSWAK